MIETHELTVFYKKDNERSPDCNPLRMMLNHCEQMRNIISCTSCARPLKRYLNKTSYDKPLDRIQVLNNVSCYLVGYFYSIIQYICFWVSESEAEAWVEKINRMQCMVAWKWNYSSLIPVKITNIQLKNLLIGILVCFTWLLVTIYTCFELVRIRVPNVNNSKPTVFVQKRT